MPKKQVTIGPVSKEDEARFRRKVQKKWPRRLLAVASGDQTARPFVFSLNRNEFQKNIAWVPENEPRFLQELAWLRRVAIKQLGRNPSMSGFQIARRAKSSGAV